MSLKVLAHGGAGSFDTKQHDGPEAAAQAGMEVLEEGQGPLEAVVAATKHLEDDERFNAGTGSNLRFDGETIEMDAAVMTSDGRYGAVAGLRRVRYPVAVATDLLETPHDLLVGEGAQRYARARGHEDHDPRTAAAEEKHAKVVEMVRTGQIQPGWSDWELGSLKDHWNYDRPIQEVFGPSDTVGAVASDGQQFAAALSTGGTAATLLGRVGDVPLPGCGLHAGPIGAVCVTGDGERLARARLADRVYGWLDEGVAVDEVVPRALALFEGDVAVGLLAVTAEGFTGGSNLPMAWSSAEAERDEP